MTETQAVELVAILQAAFWRQPIPEQAVAVYARALADLPIGPARAAVERLCETQVFFPAIAEIRAAVLGDDREAVPLVAEVLTLVMQRATNYRAGADFPRTPAGVLASQVVRAIGWQRVCQEPEKYMRREVERVAGELCDRLRARVAHGETVADVLELPAQEPRLRLVHG